MGTELNDFAEILQSGGNVAAMLAVWLAWNIKTAFVNFLKGIHDRLDAIHKSQDDAHHKLNLLLEDHPDERYRSTTRNR